MIEDVLTIAYEKSFLGDVSVLMVSRKLKDGGLEVIKVFTEDEADDMYDKLIGYFYRR